MEQICVQIGAFKNESAINFESCVTNLTQIEAFNRRHLPPWLMTVNVFSVWRGWISLKVSFSDHADVAIFMRTVLTNCVYETTDTLMNVLHADTHTRWLVSGLLI